MQKKERINPTLLPYLPFVSAFAKVMGHDCEVLLHDISIPEGSVVACVNTHVTGRKIGAPMTAFGRQLMQSKEFAESDGVYNYHSLTEDGRRLKCSVINLHDKRGKLVGLICVNIDISKIEEARNFLDEFLGAGETISFDEKKDASTKMPPIQQEKFYRELDEVWAHLHQELKKSVNAPLERLSPAELQHVIAKLDKEGFFLIKGSINFLAKELNKSRFTIYGYLRKIRNGDEAVVNSEDV